VAVRMTPMNRNVPSYHDPSLQSFCGVFMLFADARQ
jgi:hypothetical protein